MTQVAWVQAQMELLLGLHIEYYHQRFLLYSFDGKNYERTPCGKKRAILASFSQQDISGRLCQDLSMALSAPRCTGS